MLLTAIFLGWKWAALATLVSAALVSRVFLARPWLEDPAPSELAILAFFCVSCAVLIFIGQTLRRTVRELDRQLQTNRLLTDELHHRVRNTLTVIEALIRMSRIDSDLDRFREDLLGRIRALGQANQILRDGAASETRVRDLITLAIRPFENGGAFILEGPECDLDSEPAHSLMLILHELCTNAAKYGALTRPAGRVKISWSDPQPRFSLRWQEVGGPAVTPPTRSGLGLKLVLSQRTFEAVTFFEQDGMVCELNQAR
jgi:two-component sensor histidine kinase